MKYRKGQRVYAKKECQRTKTKREVFIEGTGEIVGTIQGKYKVKFPFAPGIYYIAEEEIIEKHHSKDWEELDLKYGKANKSKNLNSQLFKLEK